MARSTDVHDVTAVILGGGKGSRLFPLTQYRAKPAVGFGGKYRIIDIPLSNCINSGIKRIFVLTQFLSTSLHRHIMQTYRFDQFTEGFVEILAAQQTHVGEDWFRAPPMPCAPPSTIPCTTSPTRCSSCRAINCAGWIMPTSSAFIGKSRRILRFVSTRWTGPRPAGWGLPKSPLRVSSHGMWRSPGMTT